jgi:hypothetical protein
MTREGGFRAALLLFESCASVDRYREGQSARLGLSHQRNYAHKRDEGGVPFGTRLLILSTVGAFHGDAKILFLLSDLTACPKTHSANIYDRCQAKYEGLTTR